MNDIQEDREQRGLDRLRIAIAPALLKNELNAPPGKRREVALVRARTPSGTFEITEAKTQKDAALNLTRATPDRVVRVSRRRVWIVVIVALMSGFALGGYGLAITRNNPRKVLHSEARRPPALAAETTIAVLPFQNLSDDDQYAFVVNGMQSEILTDLSQIAGLKVVSRTSMVQYQSGSTLSAREIAKQVGARFLVEGTVQRAGGRIRVSAQLIDGQTDMHLWAEHYDRELKDVFAIENDVAEQIVSQLKGKLSQEEKAAIEGDRQSLSASRILPQ